MNCDITEASCSEDDTTANGGYPPSPWSKEQIYDLMAKRSRVLRYHFAGREIHIKEANIGIQEEVGTKVWHAGEAFCEFIQRRGRQFEDKKVIEVGAGTGLVGIVASLMGADVTLTDLKSILPNMEENVKINTEGCKHRPKVCELEWGRELHKYTKGQYDYVIGTDVVYEEHMFRSLVVTLKHLCDQKTRVLLCHHVRWPDKDEKFMKLFSESFTIVNQRRLPKQDLTVYLFEAKLKGTH
ncbi:PREDICTED: protein N-lysine methyltransferase METTL21A-like [Branchiostoma belcheri]|uniref:Protein N-lysine methyltransferase METTL21A-like n=1 Tax=Branchiostoma belcheri TaxID=7741 RepID=A0A6P4XXH7_BRABE|nr:PREDICTED: protein N-lysine methyltransferase METTL21A-like [Branchiostoma belcheri]